PQVAGKGIMQLKTAGIKVDTGLLTTQALAINPGFNKRMLQQLPWVCCKLAMSVDGRTAPANRQRVNITGASALHDVQLLRARADVVMTGIGTVQADNPALNVRLKATELPNLKSDMPVPQPWRIILDTHLRISPNAQILQIPGRTSIFCSNNADSQRIKTLTALGIDIQQFSVTLSGRINLKSALHWVAKQEINEVLLECGPTLAGAALEAHLIDELIIYIAPHLMGDQAMSLFHLPSLENNQQRINLKIKEIQSIGEDWRLKAYL
ncbi:hypothetical protein TI03_02525, partial [Achromatium sp. WMS1]